MKELKIQAKPNNLYAVLEFVDAELASFPSKTAMQICIAVEEIFINIALYAYGPQAGSAVIRVSADDSGVVIIFEDSGKPFNPFEKPDPDISEAVNEREIGRLGIFMAKKFMDFMEYRRCGDKNILTIKKGI